MAVVYARKIDSDDIRFYPTYSSAKYYKNDVSFNVCAKTWFTKTGIRLQPGEVAQIKVEVVDDTDDDDNAVVWLKRKTVMYGYGFIRSRYECVEIFGTRKQANRGSTLRTMSYILWTNLVGIPLESNKIMRLKITLADGGDDG